MEVHCWSVEELRGNKRVLAARGFSPDFSCARSEALHYFLLFSKDGPCQLKLWVEQSRPKKKKKC